MNAFIASGMKKKKKKKEKRYIRKKGNVRKK